MGSLWCLNMVPDIHPNGSLYEVWTHVWATYGYPDCSKSGMANVDGLLKGLWLLLRGAIHTQARAHSARTLTIVNWPSVASRALGCGVPIYAVTPGIFRCTAGTLAVETS